MNDKITEKNSYTEKVLNALSNNWQSIFKIARKMGIQNIESYHLIEELLEDLSKRGLIFEHKFNNHKHWSLLPNISNKMIKKLIQYKEKNNKRKERRVSGEYDTLIKKRDLNVLKELEKIPKFNFSYYIKNGSVSGLEMWDYENMNQIPEFIKELKDLESLVSFDIGNLILPEWICTLKNLQVIKLVGHNITEIPPCLKNLKNLRVLDIADNPLTIIPKFLKEMQSLEDLGLCRLKIKAPPEWLGDMKQLKKIDISGYNLGYLPEWLKKLENLEELISFYNRLKAVPDWLLDFKLLKKVDLMGQRIQKGRKIIETLKQRGCEVDYYEWKGLKD